MNPSPRVAFLAAVLLLLAVLPSDSAPGALDPTFGTGGVVLTDFGVSNTDYGQCVALQSDGKILVAGSSGQLPDLGFAIARYSSNGALDPTFGTGGRVFTDLGGGNNWAVAIALQNTQKIIVAGTIRLGQSGESLVLIRYLSNGALDSSFGTNGKVIENFGRGAAAYGMTVGVFNQIFVVGSFSDGSSYFPLARFTADGHLDPSFGNGGKAESASLNAAAVAIQSGLKIVVAGNGNTGSTTGFAVARYTPGGQLDTSFGVDGLQLTPVGTGSAYGKAVGVLSDDKVLVGGHTDAGGTTDFALVRYTELGQPDPTFGSAGKVTTSVSPGLDRATSLVVQSDRKVVLAGFSWDGSRFTLVRYTEAGTLDASFGTSGIVGTLIGSIGGAAWGVALQGNGRIIAAGHAYNDAVSLDFAVVRYAGDSAIGGDGDGDGLLDLWELTYWPTTIGHSGSDDSDHDGLTELQELAFGLDPRVSDSLLTPRPMREAGYLTYTITKRGGAAYQVESAGTVLSGRSNSFSSATTVVLVNNATTLKVRDSVAVANASRRFMRIRVTAAP